MSYSLYQFGRFKLLAARPTATGYGSAIAEILNALHLGRRLGATVFFVKPRNPLNHAIFEIESDDVPVIPQAGLRARLLRGLWTLTHVIPESRARGRRWIIQRAKVLSRNPKLSKARRGALKRWVRKIGERSPGPIPNQAFDVDFRPLYANEPVTARLPRSQEPATAAAAGRFGLTERSRIVTLHIRESSYKLALALPERPTDAMRNAQIETYLPAIDFLAARQYTVVRVGTSTATPLRRPGVIDLATSPERTEFLELWCIARSRFFIASDSGPYFASLLLNVPSLSANVTALVGGDPLRRSDLYILKRAFDRRSESMLSLAEMLTPEYLINFRNAERYGHVDNSAEEIAQAVEEMVQTIETGPRETPSQREYRRLLEALVRHQEVIRWRAAAGITRPLYLGHGRIGDAFARQHLHSHAPLAPLAGLGH